MISRIASFILCLIVGSALSGCVVTTTPHDGILQVQWRTADCAAFGIAEVDIRVRRGGFLQDEALRLSCTRGFQSFVLPADDYTVDIDSFDVSGVSVATRQFPGIAVFRDRTTTTERVSLVDSVRQAGGGAITVGWTIYGKSAATACSAHGLKDVKISVFDKNFTSVLQFATVPCNAGKATLFNVQQGEAWVLLDGIGVDGLSFYGNKSAYGPLQVLNATEVIVPAPLEIVDIRASASLQWQFANAGSCIGNNVGYMLIEVRDGNGKVIIPVTDKDAQKSCDIDAAISLKQRAIDLLFSEPDCTIPAQAKGLVICGITQGRIQVRASTVDATTGQIKFGGEMTIDAPAATHTNMEVRMVLKPCSGSNPCASP